MTDRIVRVVLRGDVTGLVTQMRAAGASVQQTAAQMTGATKEAAQFQRGMDSLGTSAGKVGLAAGVGLGLATKAAVDWESEWAGVMKTVNASPAEFDKLEAGLRDLATTLPATHEEIAGVAEAAGQLGVATKDILSFTKVMVDLGETTNLTAEDAATSIAQMANVMGTKGADIDNFGAALVALGNNGASTERQIVEMAQGIAGAGAQVGLTEAEVLSLANAAASMGIEVEAGGTAISRVFSDMAKATAQGGKELELYAQTAGLTADEFAQRFSTKPAQAFAMFTTGLDRVKESGGDVFTLLDELSLSDVRVSRALLGMAASGDLLTDSLNLGSQAWEENTALANEAEKRYATTASKVQVSINEIKDAAIEFGEAVLPVVAEVADDVGMVASAFGSLPGPVKEVATAALALTAVTGGALWFGSKVIGGIANTRAALTDVGTTMDNTQGKAVGLGRTLRTAFTVGAVIEGLDILDSTLDRILNRNLDTTKLGRSLDSLVQGNITGELADKFGKDLDDFGHQVHNAVAGGLTSFQRGLPDFIGDNPFDDAEGPKQAAENIRKIDEALAAMVDSGRGDQAAVIFERLKAAALDSGASLPDVTKAFEQYGISVGNTATEADGAADSTELLTGAMSANTGAATANAEAQEKAAKALAENRKAARDTANEFVGLGSEVDNAKVSLDDWIRGLDIQAKTLENFTANAAKAGKRNLREGLIAEFRASGEEGAMRLAELANGTDAQIAKANEAFDRGRTAVQKYTNEVGGMPKAVVKVDTKQAVTELDRIRNLIVGLPSGNAAITVTWTANVNTARADRAAQRDRAGGRDGDLKTPYWSGGYTGEEGGIVHPREYVMSEPATSGNLPQLHSLHESLKSGKSFATAVSSAMGGNGGGGELRLSDGHIEQLARAMAAVRSLTGPVTVLDGTDFERVLAMAEANASLSGMPSTP